MRDGTVLIVIGLAFVALGVVLRLAPWLVGWFGNLPGDIRLAGERTRVYIPITSMIVVSLVLTVIVNVAARLRR